MDARDHLASVRSVQDLLEAEVVDHHDRTFGRVSDLVVELDRGGLAYVIVKRIDVANHETRDDIALPFGSLRWAEDGAGQGRFVVEVSAQVFEGD